MAAARPGPRGHNAGAAWATQRRGHMRDATSGRFSSRLYDIIGGNVRATF